MDISKIYVHTIEVRKKMIIFMVRLKKRKLDNKDITTHK
jgi:hypothetical protein